MSASADGPVPNTPEAVAFLDQEFPHERRQLVSISPDGGSPDARTFLPSETTQIVAWIDERQGKRNIYYHVADLKKDVKNRKAKKADVAQSRCLHVDVDVMTEGTLDRLRAFEPAPTFIMASGGGYQVGWELEEPTADIEAVERANKALAEGLGGDNCHNADRIMRLPGTINLPNAKKRSMGRVPVTARLIDQNWDRRYKLSDFPTSSSETDLVKPAAAPAAVIKASHIVPVALEELPTMVLDSARAMIRLGDDPERPRGTATPRFRSRSEGVFVVSLELARATCKEEEIAGVLINPAYGISESILEKKAPKTYALRQARAAMSAVANGWPDADRNGQPRATMRNALSALRRMELRFSHDLFRHLKMVEGHALDIQQGEISDDGCAILRAIIIENFNFDPKAEHVRDAVNQLCLENSFHPILEMLEAFRWDGVPRLDSWLANCCGAADTPLNQAFGSMFLIAAVRRVRQPGVKFDTILILEGRQGTGKSTVLQIIAGPGNHSDNEILALDTKSQMEAMQGIWIYELGEISGLRKAEIEGVKAFASRQIDRARMAYGRFSESRPRQLVFAGTTNEDRYLRDLTGNRRFWPVKTDIIDLPALRRDRDQLLAEAAYREAKGESIELPEDLWGVAAIEQENRLEEDPWMEKLDALSGQAVGDEARVYTNFVMTETLGIEFERQHQGHAKRVSSLMRKLGWEAAKFKVGGKTVRGFRRPVKDGHVDNKPLF